MPKFNVELPTSFILRNYAGEALTVDTEKHLKPVIDRLAIVGARTVLTNVWNGGGKDATEAERHAAVMKKLDAWARGEFNVTERGESQYTAFREVYVADCIAAGLTTKQAETAIKQTVEERLGKDAKATFANFIEARAIEAAADGDMSRDEARAALEAYFTAESARREAERSKVQGKIELPKIDLAAFAKPKAK